MWYHVPDTDAWVYINMSVVHTHFGAQSQLGTTTWHFPSGKFCMHYHTTDPFMTAMTAQLPEPKHTFGLELSVPTRNIANTRELPVLNVHMGVH